MAGTSYTRQSTLTDGSLITAALFNDEYNQLLNAFVYSSTGTTGHTHDGSAGQGGAIAKIGDQDFKNKIEISSTNNRIECYIEVSGSPVEQLRIQDGAIVPVTDSDIDLGTTSLRFKDAFVDSLTVTGVVTATGFTIGSAVITEAELEILDGKTFLDEDGLTSDSATGIPSQQSVKAYVDAQVTAQDLDLTDGTTSISIDLDSEALSVLGGTGITSTASGNGVTLAIDSTVATLTGTQTLTNKTLTSPDVNGGTIDGTVIGGTAAAAGSFTTVDATGNIIVGGTVDGRDVAADGTKLDGIETAATADQTASEIRALVEAATDSNVFTDADHGKLNGIEASATADQTDAEIRAAVEAATDSNVFTDADHTKLDGIEANATADQTDAEIRTAVEAATDSNVFTDADHSKLNAIEASADVTDTANVTAAGALMDSELTAIASVKALNQGVATTDSPSFVNLTLSGTGSVKVPSGTTAQRDGSPVNGMFRYNSTNEQFEGYQSGDWGAIGGGGGSNTFTADTFTANGSTTAYALSQVINSENNLLVFIDGVFQQQSAYSIATASGTTTLTFSTAPANTREIIVYSVASAVSGSNLNTDSMTGDGSDVTLALSIAPVSENNTQVFIDGVYQNKDTYSISGTTLTFSTAPPTGSAVEVMTMTQTEVNVPVDGTITSAKLSGDLVTPSNLTVTGTATMDGLTASNTTQNDAIGIAQVVNTTADDVSSSTMTVKNHSGTGQFMEWRTFGMRIGSRIITNNGVGDVAFTHGNDVEKMRLTATGLGIGTSSPTSYAGFGYGPSVEISGGHGGSLVISDTGQTNKTVLSHYSSSGEGILKTTTNKSLHFATNDSAPKMTLDSSGNVGIGTSSPDAIIETSASAAGNTVGALLTNTNGSGTADSVSLNFGLGRSVDGYVRSVQAIKLLKEQQWTGTASTVDAALVFNTVSDETTAERMRIDSSGNVGIGVSNPTSIQGFAKVLKLEDSSNASIVVSGGSHEAEYAVSSSGGWFGTGTNIPQRFVTNNTERMRIDSSGNLTVGDSSTANTGNSACTISAGGAITTSRAATNNQTHHSFMNPNGVVGTIKTIASQTSFNTSSDQRLKENIADADDAGSKIDAIQVRQYDWKVDGSHQDYGMIAQELQAVAPEAVSGDADSEEMMGVDYSKLVPMLVKEIQSLRNRVAQLEE